MKEPIYKKSILLTGAGFTANVGGFLADEMWSRILNHSSLIKQPKLVKTMIDESYQFNYEALYQEILQSSKFDNSDKEAFQEAIKDAYTNLNKIVLDPSKRSSLMALHTLERFIVSFSGNENEVGAVFTLNQDLFLESLLYNGRDPPKINIPLAPDYPFNNGSELKDHRGDVKISETFNEAEAFSKLTKSPYLNYFKLHGSFDWLDSSGKNLMIIGPNKRGDIKKYPVLEWYYEQFKRAIHRKDARLLIIGYGFRDAHINKEIRDSCKDNNLKVFIIQPDSPRDFYARFVHRKGSGYTTLNHKEIWEGVNGYFPHSLEKIFSKDNSGGQYQEELRQHFPF